jgi:hypothetical protein
MFHRAILEKWVLENEKAQRGGWAFRNAKTRPGYPARRDSGPRAREVMPAAMRAELRTTASAWFWVMAFWCIGRAWSHGAMDGARRAMGVQLPSSADGT